jgi:hypothetical protein
LWFQFFKAVNSFNELRFGCELRRIQAEFLVRCNASLTEAIGVDRVVFAVFTDGLVKTWGREREGLVDKLRLRFVKNFKGIGEIFRNFEDIGRVLENSKESRESQ